jgi:hypothetical protein
LQVWIWRCLNPASSHVKITNNCMTGFFREENAKLKR